MRQIMGELFLSKLSDPRIDRARTSVTRVEVGEDLLTAKVYVSVMGTEGQQRRTIQALSHASGHIQELMARKMRTRHTPVLTFVLDAEFKKTLETLDMIQRVSNDIQQKDLARIETVGQAEDETPSQPETQTSPQSNTNQDQRQ